MDPDANLEEQLLLASGILVNNYPCPSLKEGDATTLAMLVQALDGWIRKGGALPTPWHDAVYERNK